MYPKNGCSICSMCSEEVPEPWGQGLYVRDVGREKGPPPNTFSRGLNETLLGAENVKVKLKSEDGKSREIEVAGERSHPKNHDALLELMSMGKIVDESIVKAVREGRDLYIIMSDRPIDEDTLAGS